ncbi:MAG: PepSY-associated TM helix domain-containing protein, partial [Polyangiaceae bacterium]
IHVRIFRDFFTFRPRKPLQRSSLDLHNLAGVLGLPFHFTMALSGLVIFFSLYMPWTWKAAYQGDNAAFTADTFGSFRRSPLKAPGSVGSIDAMVAEAERRWGEGSRASFVRVANPADAASVVEVRRSGSKQVTLSREQIYFDGASGQLLSTYESKPVARVQSFVSGIHFTQFDDWTLRWLYFLGGASGCVLIATGLLFWLESRRKRHEREGRAGARVVEAMAVSAVPGIMVATLAFFIANRCLPAGASFAGEGRADLEMWAFYLVWLATFVDAGLRARAAWRDQAWAIAALAPAAVLANWLSTGDHPLRALERGVPAVAGMDALLVLTGGVALWTARRLGRERAPARSELRAPAVLATARGGERHA